MDKENIINFIDKIQQSWAPVCLKVSILSTLGFHLIPYFYPSIQLDPKWLFSSIYLGLISLVFILLEIHKKLLEKEEIKEYPNMKAAEQDMLQKIDAVSKKRRNSPIDIRVLGNRLSRISPILSDIFRKSKDGRFGQNEIQVVVYHTDPSLLSEYLPSKKDRRSTEDKHRTYSDNLLSNIQWLRQEVEECPNVSIRFVKYVPIPYFYAYLIDLKYLFFGYFVWDEILDDWVGPSNPCYFFEKNRDDPTYFVEWLINRLKIYDTVFDKI